MKQKNIFVVLLFIFSILCATAYIGYNYYDKYVGAYKNISPKLEVKLVSFNDSSYLELKISITKRLVEYHQKIQQ